MTRNTRRLVLRVIRFQNACEALAAAHDEALAFDRGFDGGEFSGPAHGRLLGAGCDRLAQRFGFASADVAQTVATAVVR